MARVSALVLLLAACRHDGAAASARVIDGDATAGLLTCPAGAIASGRVEAALSRVR